MKVPAEMVELERNYLDCWKPPPKIIVHNAEEAMRVLQDARDGDPALMPRAMLAVQLWLIELTASCEIES